MGRLLNPENQKMLDLIFDMPRLWRLYYRVRGVAWSSNMFQFILNSKDDLNTVLVAGAWTYNEWGFVFER